MTSKTVRIGAKGQIVLQKDLRDKLGLEEGRLVEERIVGRGILITPIDVDALMKRIEKTARSISSVWPKGLTSVEAVRRDRE